MKTKRFVYAVLKMEWIRDPKYPAACEVSHTIVGVYKSHNDAKTYIAHNAAANGYVGSWVGSNRWEGLYGVDDAEGVTYMIFYTALF